MPEATTTLRIPNYASAPVSGLAKGQLYFNTSNNTFYYYDGTSWVAVGSGTATGNVSSAGTPGAGQLAVWTDPTHIQGVADTTKQWDGGSGGLNAGTGRTSLGLGTAALLPAPSGALVGTTDAQALTNKEIVPRTQLVANTATTITPNADTDDLVYGDNMSAATITINAPSGSPVNGQEIMIRLKSGNLLRTLVWNAIYGGGTLPTRLPAATGSYINMTFRYNADAASASLPAWKLITCNVDGDVPSAAQALLTGAPTSPGAISGATNPGKMCGLAQYFTPTRTGNVLALLSCDMALGTAGGVIWGGLRYGTGTAPVFGAASVGNGAGSYNLSYQGVAGALGIPATFFGAIFGLALNTQVWLDIVLINTGTVSTVTINYPAVQVIEL